ncbi:hypothetical protein PROFUN_01316 [Planoprotostelium fungivorum]|uniref:Uncharacterized protein n=1 Tax=Planoprotostelium fungivorum TaxID=1890364 RepID=A0A2P6NZQ5_9EUKA|nr:hypothetical protein PROFUN_01316 [Planoprotostelium fungivorum]
MSGITQKIKERLHMGQQQDDKDDGESRLPVLGEGQSTGTYGAQDVQSVQQQLQRDQQQLLRDQLQLKADREELEIQRGGQSFQGQAQTFQQTPTSYDKNPTPESFKVFDQQGRMQVGSSLEDLHPAGQSSSTGRSSQMAAQSYGSAYTYRNNI